jgi:transport and Golgi organization protein 2
MCLLALFFRAVDDAPVVVGANREEFYARGGEPPRLLPGQPRIVAGLDPVAGGTWLGVNEFGVVIAVTNRRKSQIPPLPRSRGLLVRELLASRSAIAAAERATRELDGGQYAGCNLLCVDAERAVVIQAGDWLRVRPLPSGLHVLSNGDVNDEGNRRVGHALWTLGCESYASGDDCLAALRRLCSDTGPPDAPMCFYGKEGGTVSSTLIALRLPPARGTLLHAQGPPDRTPYADASDLLRQLGPASNGAARPEG